MILDRYRIISKIGNGAFGKVYKCYDTKHSRIIALKTGDPKQPRSQQRMQQEFEIYSALQGSPGIPKLYTFHKSNSILYLSMECMGVNLMKLWKLCNQQFSEKTVLMVAIQMLFRLETLHKNHILHRDIKPDNFVLGRDAMNTSLYLLDFGLSIKMTDRQEPLFTGSLRYASRNNHKGRRYTRIDDLESWLYIVIYFMKGELPWQNTMNSMTQANIHKLQKEIGLYKERITPDELCRGLPNWLLNIARSLLHPNAVPQYGMYVDQMKNRMRQLRMKFDYQYDWTNLPTRVLIR